MFVVQQGNFIFVFLNNISRIVWKTFMYGVFSMSQQKLTLKNVDLEITSLGKNGNSYTTDEFHKMALFYAT